MNDGGVIPTVEEFEKYLKWWREEMNYSEESDGEKGRLRDGSPRFYKLLEEMAETHDKKSHDYASNKNPSGNYHFAGQMASMFSHSPQDAGFVGRIAEKIYRLANLESGGKTARNESVEDTERDIAVITVMWMADRRDRRGGVREVYKEAAGPTSKLTASHETIELLHSIIAASNHIISMMR